MKSIFMASLALFAGTAMAQENYSTAWSQHKFVIVDTRLAGIAATQVNFPLLVRLGAADSAIFSQAKTDGADLRFTKADNTTRLPHQIESWNATTKSAAIWVLVDTLVAPKNNNAFRIHWGNSAANDSSNGAQVFKTANGYQAVWHMNGSANETDATANGFTATQNGTVASAAGAIGGARTVSTGNYFRANGTASGALNFAEGSNFTVSTWVFVPTAFASAGTVVSKHDRTWALKLNQAATDWEFFEFGTEATSAGWNYVNAANFEDLGVWRNVVGVRSPDGVGLFVDGVLRMDNAGTAGSTNARMETIDVTIGAQPTSNTVVERPFDGHLDELRLSNVARSEDWIKLEFENQKPASQVARLMDAVPAAVSRAATRGARALTAKAEGQGLSFRFAADGAVKAQVSVTDMRGAPVWSQVADARTGSLSWNGIGAAGLAPQGVYAVRVKLLDARGAVLRVLESRVPLTR